MSITPDGKLLLVANRSEGSVSMSALSGKEAREVAKLTVGKDTSMPSHVAITPDGTRLTKAAEAPIGRWSQGIAFSTDGKSILVQNMVEENAMVFQWDGARLVDTKRNRSSSAAAVPPFAPPAACSRSSAPAPGPATADRAGRKACRYRSHAGR